LAEEARVGRNSTGMTRVSEVGYGAYKPAAGETKGANSLEVFYRENKTYKLKRSNDV